MTQLQVGVDSYYNAISFNFMNNNDYYQFALYLKTTGEKCRLGIYKDGDFTQLWVI